MIAITIPHLADAAARRFGDAEAVVDGDRRVGFAELRERMIETAAAFIAAGLGCGERVAIWAPNSLEWIVAALGIQAAGGVLIPLNTRYKAAEAEYILRRSKAAIAVVFGDFLGLSACDMLAGMDLPHLRRTVRIDGGGADGWAAFLAGGAGHRDEAERRLALLSPDDVSDIMFTSGTTGDPKGAVTTHRQTVTTSRLWCRATTLGPADRFAILWPFFHCSGYKAGWVACLVAGATAIPVPMLDADALLALTQREKISFLPGPPTLFQTLLTMPDRPAHALDTVRVSVTGASSVAPSLIDSIRDTLGIPDVVTGYGLTETCGTVSMSNPSDPAIVLTSTSGKPLDGVEVRIVDDTGRDMPRGEAGEIIVRGMNVMQGYLDDPEATREAFNSEGWLLTGDIGLLDENGNLKITDRKKEMFIVGGFNCYPAEIEKILMRHPALLQAAVVSEPDERMGEVGVAHVVLKPGERLDADELIGWARAHMANFKVPRRVIFSDELPLTATGKVQKFRLQARSAA